MDGSCIFCAIVAGEAPARFVYQDDDACAFLDINPLRPGHTLVVPHLHAPDLTADRAPTAIAARDGVGRPALDETYRVLVG